MKIKVEENELNTKKKINNIEEKKMILSRRGLFSASFCNSIILK